MLTLYEVEWCPQCHRVRQVMTELGLTYTAVNVAADPDERDDVLSVSGKDGVPMLIDGDEVIPGSDDIVAHLRAAYPAREDTLEHASKGRFRIVTHLDLAPPQALERLRAVFECEGVPIVACIPGDDIAPGLLPDGYVLVQAAVPAAAARVVEVDPTTPTAVTIAIALYARGGGTEIAVTRPQAGSWLYGIPEIARVNKALADQVLKAVREL
jgi:glutaredoxin